MKGLTMFFPNDYRYSETFITNHIQGLDPDFTLTGGWRPYIDKEGKSIFSESILANNYCRALVKRIFPSFYQKQYTRVLTRYLQETKTKICFIEYGVTAASVYQACIHANVPYVVHFHGFDAFEFLYIQKYREAYKSMFSSAKHIVSVSEDMSLQLVKLGAKPEQITVIPCGINSDKFTINSSIDRDPDQLIFVGRFTEKKSPINLLKAFKIVIEQVPSAKLELIGDGELLNKAIMFAKENNLGTHVQFLGVLKHPEIINKLQRASIFVQHSMFSPSTGDSEGTPGTVLEASACELAVVSTKHAGIKQAVIDGHTGYLVDEGDYEAMAQRIIELLHDPAKTRNFGKNGRKHIVSNYDLKLQINKLKNTLKLNNEEF